LIGEFEIRRTAIRFGVHDGHADVEVAARPNHTQGDLTPIGNENFLEHG